MTNEDLIATLIDTAEVEGPGTMGCLLKEAAERIIQQPYKWISVKNKLPRKFERVIVAVYGSDLINIRQGETVEDAIKRVKKEVRYVTLGNIDDDGYWNGEDGYPMMVSPSYWMPLPELPN